MNFLSRIKALWFVAAASDINKPTTPVLVEDDKDSAFMIPEHILNKADVTNEMACEIVTVMVGDMPIVSVSGATEQTDIHVCSDDQ